MSRPPLPRPEPQISPDGLSIGVPLTQGKFAWIDAADWPAVSTRNWYAMRQPRGRWYARTEYWIGGGKKVGVYIHRMIRADVPRQTDIDHIDGDGLNNTRSNLRVANRSQNAANAGQRSDSLQPHKGIVRVPSGKWAARVRTTHIGTFATEEAAARAYDHAARSLFGKFARLNFPEEP
jgi:HNH endonuclease